MPSFTRTCKIKYFTCKNKLLRKCNLREIILRGFFYQTGHKQYASIFLALFLFEKFIYNVFLYSKLISVNYQKQLMH